MDTDPLTHGFNANIIAGIIAVIVLLICSGLVSASETGFFGLSAKDKSKIKSSKSDVARRILKLLNEPEELLATILVVNNFINIAIVIITTYLTTSLLRNVESQWLIILVQTIGITFFILLFGEMVPKILASKYPLAISKTMAYPLMGLEKMCYPLSIILIKSTNIVNKRLKKNYKNNISIEDLSQAIELASDDLKDDKEMLEDIVNSSNLDARDIMTSRVDVFAIEYNTKFEDVIKQAVESGFSRIPVYSDNLDYIKGMLYIKDILPHIDEKDFDWHQLLRDQMIIPESKKINDILHDFQTKKLHIAIVIDEYGGVSGLVTLEDILEEFVGEIHDESDVDEQYFKKLGNRTYEFDAKTSIVDFCKIIDIDYDIFADVKGDSETLAGLILEVNQEIPAKDKKITIKDFEFTIISADERRIKKLRILIPEKKLNQDEEK